MGRLTEHCARMQGTARRRLTHIGPLPRPAGPLEAGYNPTEWPIRVQAGARVCQLLDIMGKAYKADDRAMFDECVLVLRRFYDALHADVEDDGDVSWTDALLEEFYRRYWPDWRYHAKNQHENCNTASTPN